MCTCVQLSVVDVAVLAVCKDKCLLSPLGWFLWEVLDEGKLALETNHRLINQQLMGGVVGLLEVFNEGSRNGRTLKRGCYLADPS